MGTPESRSAHPELTSLSLSLHQTQVKPVRSSGPRTCPSCSALERAEHGEMGQCCEETSLQTGGLRDGEWG